MDALATVARRRAVITTIVDLIVAAAAGKTLRVAVGCTHPDVAAFVDQLAQALHARGRPCRCLPSSPDEAVSWDGSAPAGSPTVAVITSGSPGADDTDLCRIDIEVRAPLPVSAPVHSDAGGPSRSACGHHAPDIVVDEIGPDGPTIRHIESTLTSPSNRL